MEENNEITEEQIHDIEEIITMLLKKQDDNFELIYEVRYFQDHFNDFKYLSKFRDFIQSPTPSIVFHIFAFFKVEYIATNYSFDWPFNVFSEICDWLVQYAVTFSDYVIDSPRALLISYVRCFMSILNAAAVRYPFSQEFWNSIAQFVETINTNKSSLSYIALIVLSEVVKNAEEEASSIENKEKIKKRDFQIEKNRQTVYDFSVQILEVCYEGQIPQDGENPKKENDKPLINLAFKTVMSLSNFARSDQMRLFLAYALLPGKNDRALSMCIECLYEGKDELDGSEGEVDSGAVSAVEEVVLSAGPSGKSQLEEAIESEVTILYFTRFVLLMMHRGVHFSLLFAAGLAAFTQEFFSADLLVQSAEAALNLIEFFSLFEGIGYEQPPKPLQETVFESVMKAALTDTRRFVELFGIGQPYEERLTSLFASLFRSNFLEIVDEMKNQIAGCIREKEETEQNATASCAFCFLVRVTEHLVEAQMKSKNEEGVADTLLFMVSVQSEVIAPSLSISQENQHQMFEPADVMAILMFDSMLAHFDEVDAFASVSPGDYSDFLKDIIAVCHIVIATFGIESQQANLALSILAAVLQRRESSVLVDTDWMLDESRKFEISINSLDSFDNAASLVESIFFNELAHTDPRIDSLIDYATQGLDDLVELFESNDKDAQTNEFIKNQSPAIFARVLAGVSGVLSSFDKFCGGISLSSKTVIGQNEVEYGRSIVDLLCQDIFNAIIGIAELIVPTDISGFMTPCFLIFLCRLARVVRRDFFGTNSTQPNEIFKDASSFVRRFIDEARSKINEIDSKAATTGADDSLLEYRARMFATISLCVRCAAELLSSDAVCFGAFLMYEDECYTELVDAAVDACEFIGVVNIIENGAVDGFDFGFGSDFDIVSAFTSLAESFYLLHLHLLSERPGCERFDTFFASSLRLVAIMPGGYNLLSIVVHELYKIAAFDGFRCDAAVAVSEQLEAAVSSLLDEVFIELHSGGEDAVQSDSALFAEYCCINEEFAQGIEARLMPVCKKLRRIEVSSIIGKICEESSAHNVELVKDMFVRLHEIWIK